MVTPRVDAPISWTDPVNWLHPANRELRGWWMAAPGTTGGKSIVDLCQISWGTWSSASTETPSWYGTNRPGGFASVNFAATGTTAATAEYFTCGSNPRLELQSNTFMAWVKPSAISTRRMLAGRSNNISSEGYEWSVQSSGQIAWAYYDGSVRGWFDSSASAVTVGVWKHIAIVARVPDGAVDFYVNGLPFSTASTGVTSPIVNSRLAVFDIGHASANAGFTGELDDIRVHNYPMRADEVRNCYELSCRGWPGALNRIPLPRYAPQGGAGFVGFARRSTRYWPASSHF